MHIPSVKPIKFTYETEEILKHFSLELNSDIAKINFPRLHKENIFNKRFSGVLTTFSDVKSVTERITNNIQASMKSDSEGDNLTAQIQTDLKTLYVNSKIFLDEYTSLLRFIFNWRGIGDKSVTSFYNSLEKYDGKDAGILAFKESCLKKLKAVNVYITEYRDKKVVHNQQRHKQDTEWFLNNMNGEVRFVGGGRPSITPQEILFIVVEYVDDSSKYCIEWLSNQISSKI